MKSPKTMLINCGSSYFEKLKERVEENTKKLSVCDIEKLDEVDLTDFDCFIISGSPKLFVEIDKDFFLRKARSCFQQNKPVLGICFGHQLIGLYHGSEISIGEKRTGNENISVLKDSILFAGLDKSFIQHEFHKEEITLPINFNLLATSDRTPIEAMQHKFKPIFGTQFHPEASGETGEKIITNFFNLVSVKS